jgi:hypothetical protein
MVLEESTIAAGLVHRDFENEIASFGDIVNTRRPGKFTAKRKVDGDNITIQPATATVVQVPLDQHLHTSFQIHDRVATTSFRNLVDEYLKPALVSLARQLDSVVLGQRYEFLGNVVGKIGTTPTKDTLVDLNTKMHNQLMPDEGRVVLISADTEGALLKEQQFTDADRLGDDGSAIRNATIGKKYGANYLQTTNLKKIATGANHLTTGFLVNLTAGYAAGSTVLVVDGGSGALTSGTWCLIAGDDTPQYITAHSENTGGDTIGITISPGLRNAVVNNAVITVFDNALINEASGYADKYNKMLTIDGVATYGPQLGQMVSLATGGGTPVAVAADPVFSALDLGSTAAGVVIDRKENMLLNRSLARAQVNNDVVGIGPYGDYNWAFHRNAVALVTRPLAVANNAFGVQSAVASLNNLSVRVTFGYDIIGQATIVTVDMLCGVKTLDTNLGVVFLA